MVIYMKDSLKEIILLGLGAVSLTGEKASELKKELLEKGEALYKEGAIKNEELKRDIKEKIKEEIKENTNIQYAKVTKDDLVDIINSLSDEEKEEISNLLKNNSDDCKCNENSDNCKCSGNTENCECEDSSKEDNKED